MIKRLILCLIFSQALILPCFGQGFDITQPDCDDGDATTWCVRNTEDTINNADCGGSCDGGDTIWLEGGAWGSLKIEDLDGAGSYITIKNENETLEADSRVVITSDETSASQNGALAIVDCRYVSLQGDGWSGHSWSAGTKNTAAYGIKVIMNADITPSTAGAIWISRESEYIKISYTENDLTGCTNTEAVGIKVNSGAVDVTDTWTYEGIEIFRNYIHDTPYSGMYVGHNYPPIASPARPYLGNVSIHDNLLEDLGTYGFNIKGVESGAIVSAYNNIVRPSTRTNAVSTGVLGDPNYSARMFPAISTSWYYGTSYAVIRNNWLEKTADSAIKVSDAAHLVYENIILEPGVYGDGVSGPGWLEYEADCVGLDDPYDCCTGANAGTCFDADKARYGVWYTDVNSPSKSGLTSLVYDNLVINADNYGMSNRDGGTDCNSTLSRNIILGSSEFESVETGIVESGAPNANIHYAAVSSIALNKWSDDSNFSNDAVMSYGLSPANGATGVSINPTLTWTNFVGIDSISLYFECGDPTPDVLVVDQNLQASYAATASKSSTCYWQLISHTAGLPNETGDIYSFTTTGRRIISIE